MTGAVRRVSPPLSVLLLPAGSLGAAAILLRLVKKLDLPLEEIVPEFLVLQLQLDLRPEGGAAAPS